MACSVVKKNQNQSAEEIFAVGLEALDKGQYAEAFEIFGRLANQGDADAQYNLGQMYEEGQRK